MTDPLGKDPLFGFLKTAMDATSLQHRVQSANLANIDTPGYRAMKVDFRQVLRDYEAHESLMNANEPGLTESGHGKPPKLPFDLNAYVAQEHNGLITQRPDGNNVDLDRTLADMGAARGNYQLASMFMTRKVRLMTEVINTRV